MCSVRWVKSRKHGMRLIEWSDPRNKAMHIESINLRLLTRMMLEIDKVTREEKHNCCRRLQIIFLLWQPEGRGFNHGYNDPCFLEGATITWHWHTKAAIISEWSVLESPWTAFAEITDRCAEGVVPLAILTVVWTFCTTRDIQQHLVLLFASHNRNIQMTCMNMHSFRTCNGTAPTHWTKLSRHSNAKYGDTLTLNRKNAADTVTMTW